VQNPHAAAIELLLDAGADVNAAGSRTPLALAVDLGNAEVVELLLRRGARVDAAGIATQPGSVPLLLAVRRAGGDADGDEDVVRMARLLLAAGADVGVRGRNGDTPLHRAAAEGRTDLVGVFLDHGATVDARNDWGWTPLHYAATQGHHATAELLLRRGANPGVKDDSGRTAADHVWGDEEMEELLQHYTANRPAKENTRPHLQRPKNL
jgi:ankyrin repeat protein